MLLALCAAQVSVLGGPADMKSMTLDGGGGGGPLLDSGVATIARGEDELRALALQWLLRLRLVRRGGGVCSASEAAPLNGEGARPSWLHERLWHGQETARCCRS